MGSDLTGRTLGEFVVESLIAEGGGGTVYRAFQASLDRRVAVKVMDGPPRKGLARERFLRESQLASQLDHPYAAHVHASGCEPDGLLWIAMELVPGTDLEKWLRSNGPMPPELFVPFLERLAAAVDAVHGHGIVHRDVKTSNVMVIEGHGGMLPKLLDFGIAKAERSKDPGPETPPGSFIYGPGAPEAPPEGLGSVTGMGPPAREHSITPTGEGIGSWACMSPEQWDDASSAGRATDIYSLGILAYRALAGRYPFVGKTENEYFHLHREAAPPPLGGGLPTAFDRVIARALAKKPEERHGSALEFAADFRAALRAEPRERLRSTAQQWDDLARPPELLLRGKVLTDVRSSVPPEKMSELECSFVKASHRRARHVWLATRLFAAVVAVGAIGASVWHWALRAQLAEQQAQLAEQQARAAREVAEVKITESALERGRSELLHGESEAFRNLSEAYRRDPAPSTAFMLARAMQSRLAEKARLAGTHGRMWWATFSPDGSQIATADDRAAQVWDGKTYRLLFTLPHGCEVSQAVYSPDGMKLVTVAREMVRIWDARSGTLLRDFKAPRGLVSSAFDGAAISPDGRLVAAIGATGALTRVWDMDSAALVAELRASAASTPLLAFSADGWLAVTGGNEARVFDVHGWGQVMSVPGPVRSLAADARNRLVTGSATGEVALWNVRSGSRLRQLRPSGEPVDAVAFSPDGSLVAAGSRDGALQAWQADSGALRSQLNPRHGRILWVEFAPDAASFLAAHADGAVVVADVVQGLAIATLDSPKNAVRVARFGSGSRVVAASWDGAARIWEATSPYRRSTTTSAGGACNIGMGSRPDRRFIAVGCRNLPTRVWDTAGGLMLAELPSSTPLEADGFISAAPAVSYAGELAAVARGTAVAVYGLPGGRLLRTVEHGAPVSFIAFADSGRAMVSGALDGSVHVMREDGTDLAVQASGGVSAAALLPDGRILAADAERRLRAFAADGRILADLSLPARIWSLRPAAARLVAIPSRDDDEGAPLLIDLDMFRVVARFEGHVGQVISARWVPGNRVLTAGADGTARLWDGATGRHLQTYSGGPRFLADADLVSDGIVVGGGADGLLRFWDAGSGAKLWTLPAHKSAVISVHLEGTDIVTRGYTGEISRWRLPQSEAVIDACARSVPCAIVP